MWEEGCEGALLAEGRGVWEEECEGPLLSGILIYVCVGLSVYSL